MKTRKLTKKSLNELAQVMPVLSEKEQDELVGGAQLFTKDGTYLGQVGTSQEVRIATENTYTQLQSYDLSYQDSLVGNMSSGLSGQSIQTMNKVMNSIAEMAGVETGIIVKSVNDTNSYGACQKDGTIYLNLNSPTFQYEGCNMYDFMSTIVHENFHKNDKDGGSTAEREIRALQAEQSGSMFYLASKSYRDTVQGNIDDFKRELDQQNTPYSK